MADDYFAKTKEGFSTLVVTPTWDEHDRVTHAIREKLKSEGVLPKEEVSLNVYRSLNFTQVEKRYAPNFDVGTFISFHSNAGNRLIKKPQFKQGEIWKIIANSQLDVTLKNEQGLERTIEPRNYYKTFDVVQSELKPFAPGDSILMKANYASSPINKIPNGAIKKIERIEKDGTLYLEGGKKLDPKFRHFVHGYAVTSQASQGKTRDYVILSADSSAARALSSNQFYVSVSRGVRGVSIFTDDLTKFKRAVEESSSRKLVTERVVVEGIFKQKFEKLKVKFTREVDKAQESAKKLAREGIEKAFRKFKDKNNIGHSEKSEDELRRSREKQTTRDRGMDLER